MTKRQRTFVSHSIVVIHKKVRIEYSVTVVQATCGCISSPISGHDIWHCWHGINAGRHLDVAGRHPGKSQLSVAKGCADGVVSDQCQKKCLGVGINILPIL